MTKSSNVSSSSNMSRDVTVGTTPIKTETFTKTEKRGDTTIITKTIREQIPVEVGQWLQNRYPRSQP